MDMDRPDRPAGLNEGEGGVADGMHDVGGMLLPRPFQVVRIGHVGFNVTKIEQTLDFFCNLLGFHISDTIDLGALLPPEERPIDRSGIAFFLRHGSDHHSFVLFPEAAAKVAAQQLGAFPIEVTANQISWQAGGLRQVVEGNDWMQEHGRRVVYSGRDIPGSNFHFYTPDDEGHLNEVFYGMEQIGWNGKSKPGAVRDLIGYAAPPPIPHRSEAAELRFIADNGIDLDSGLRATLPEAETHDVDGVLLERPFKIVKVGPLRLFVKDVQKALHFYRDLLGLKITETVNWNGHICVFLRAGLEHHSLALYPIELREVLGLSKNTTAMALGMRVGSYSQLRAAIAYLSERGVEIRKLPPELFPGIDYSALAISPCGHAVQLHYYMEQLGWNGEPCPPELRRQVDNDHWPETLEPLTDSFFGETFFGPLG